MANENKNGADSVPAIETKQCLEDIRSMMDAGHKSIRIEKHTFFYWGIAGGLLTALVEFLYRNVSMLMNTPIYIALLAIILGAVGYFDYRKTREIRRSQDKSVSFIQVRMTRIWWLLIGTGALFVAGTMVYGGIAVYSIWFVLVGVAIIIHASFSTQPLGYYGVALIAIGIISPALLPYSGLMWLAVSVFSIGIPLLGFMLYRKSGFWKADKPYAVVVWLILAVVPGYAVYEIKRNIIASHIPHVPTATLSLAEYQNNPAAQQKHQIVILPAGTIVPLKLSAKGSFILDSAFVELPLELKKSIEVVVENGNVTGMYRVGQGEWSSLWSWELFRLNDLFINITPEEGLTMDSQIGISDRK